MTLDEYKQKIGVIITPDGEPDPHPSGKGGLAAETTFWLHTSGLPEFDRPELEMRNVPALFIGAAAAVLNEWGHYSVTEKPIEHGQNIQTGSPIPVILRASESTDEFWAERGTVCLRLESFAVLFSCGHPNHSGKAVQ